MRHSVDLALEHNLEDIAALGYTNLAAGQCEMYRFAEADFAIEEGLAYCIARDLDHRTTYLKAWRVVSYDYQGRRKEARDVAADVLRQPRISPITRLVTVVAAGRVRARQGHPDAYALLDEALELALPTGELQRLGLPVGLLQIVAPREPLMILSGFILIGYAAWKVATRFRHPRWVGMRVTRRELVSWSA